MPSPLPPELLSRIAERFQGLSEPARLQLLSALMDGEASVGALAEATGLKQANVSRHLATLHRLKFVERRKQGLYTFYRIGDPGVFELCELMCGRVQADMDRVRAVLESAS